MTDLEFSGRVAIITGAARGMGAAAARRLVAAGAKVSLWDVNQTLGAELAADLGGPSIARSLSVNIGDAAAVAAGTDAAIEAFGKIDVLINCAGIAGVNASVEEFPEDIWRRVMDINLTGTFLTCQAVVPHMKANKYGRIVNVASVAGKEGNPNASAYSASKAGMISLTKSLGKELATAGITVNAITPAVIKTEMLEDVTDAQLDYMLSKIPMARPGTVEEVAEMIAFLASDRASFSTAAVFDMTGGRATY